MFGFVCLSFGITFFPSWHLDELYWCSWKSLAIYFFDQIILLWLFALCRPQILMTMCTNPNCGGTKERKFVEVSSWYSTRDISDVSHSAKMIDSNQIWLDNFDNSNNRNLPFLHALLSWTSSSPATIADVVFQNEFAKTFSQWEIFLPHKISKFHCPSLIIDIAGKILTCHVDLSCLWVWISCCFSSWFFPRIGEALVWFFCTQELYSTTRHLPRFSLK